MQATRHIPGMLNEAITLIARLYDHIDTLEEENEAASERAKQFENQLKKTHEEIAELSAKANDSCWLTMSSQNTGALTHPPDQIAELLPNRWKPPL